MDAAPDVRLPDFYIAGPQKSGTTSLRHILDHHEALYLPDFEPLFFCLDDFEVNHRYFPAFDDETVDHDFERDFDQYYEWFADRYDKADPEQTWGEDAPGYFRSEKAPRRIRSYVPDAKLIFLLRNPVDRAYSHYWHLYRLGRVTGDFDTTFREELSIYRESLYERHLRRFLSAFDHDQVEIVVFERFVTETEAVIDQICEFLGCNDGVDLEEVGTRHNTGGTPPRPLMSLKYLAAGLRRLAPRMEGVYRREEPIPNLEFSRLEAYGKMSWSGLFGHLTGAALDRLVELFPRRSYPAMPPQTREFLGELFARENRGLPELVDIDLAEYWPHMRSHG